eukprot:1154238-Pelagomonas_calceolata.AAC.8
MLSARPLGKSDCSVRGCMEKPNAAAGRLGIQMLSARPLGGPDAGVGRSGNPNAQCEAAWKSQMQLQAFALPRAGIYSIMT